MCCRWSRVRPKQECCEHLCLRSLPQHCRQPCTSDCHMSIQYPTGVHCPCGWGRSSMTASGSLPMCKHCVPHTLSASCPSASSLLAAASVSLCCHHPLWPPKSQSGPRQHLSCHTHMVVLNCLYVPLLRLPSQIGGEATQPLTRGIMRPTATASLSPWRGVVSDNACHACLACSTVVSSAA